MKKISLLIIVSMLLTSCQTGQADHLSSEEFSENIEETAENLLEESQSESTSEDETENDNESDNDNDAFSRLPAWMIAYYDALQNSQWEYQQLLMVDLNCDYIPEFIMIADSDIEQQYLHGLSYSKGSVSDFDLTPLELYPYLDPEYDILELTEEDLAALPEESNGNEEIEYKHVSIDASYLKQDLATNTIDAEVFIEYAGLWYSTSGSYEYTIEPEPEPVQYCKYIDVPATEHMPELSFEIIAEEQYDMYYPLKLVVNIDGSIIQEINFEQDGFEFYASYKDDFGFEYGDFKFDGYSGFKMLWSSTGRNYSSYFWVWDNEKYCFVEYPDLEMLGYVSFDYDNQLVHVSETASAACHIFSTYQYIDGELTLIESIVDQDTDGYRKVYKRVDGEMELIEVTDSQLKG